MGRHEITDADVTVVVPDEPPVLTPYAATALLRLIRDALQDRGAPHGLGSPGEPSAVEEANPERRPDQ